MDIQFQRYIERNIASTNSGRVDLPEGVSLIVVIPCYNEKELCKTLFSLSKCKNPGVSCAVVIVVNSSETDTKEIRVQNEATLIEIEQDKELLENEFCTFHGLNVNLLPRKFAGVGLARKIGMDIAIEYWQEQDYPKGILVSLDADTIVEDNYFISIVQSFNQNPRQVAATINFAHNLQIEDPVHKRGIVLYELYMRYYKTAMEYSGFCPSIYTIGSCFAVRAKAYVAQGGMNRRKAGEDFYFLHKLAPLGEIGTINNTTVCLSSRMSDRVPFGTGPQLKRWINEEVDLEYTYPFYLFQTLYDFFSQVEHIYKHDLESGYSDKLFEQFVLDAEMEKKINELKKNCGSFEMFKRRFFHLFNAFTILKWLNFAQNHGVRKQNILEAVNEMLKAIDRSALQSNEEFRLLLNLRELERQIK